MAKLKIVGAGLHVIAEVDAIRFAHYVDNIRFWFGVHEAHDRTNQLVVTHWDSGMRVTTIPVLRLSAYRLNQKAAAKATLDELIEKHGAARVRSVIASAEKAKEKSE